MNNLTKDITPNEIQQIGNRITNKVGIIIEKSRRNVAVYLNSEISMTYWRIGKYIVEELDAIGDDKYGSRIVSTVSKQLTARFGKGYTRSAIIRMVKVAREYPEEQIAATLSQQLTWSHFVELITISKPAKRLFYQQMSILNSWSVRQLRDQEDSMAYERALIATKPEEEQIKVLSTVTEGNLSPDVILKSSYIGNFSWTKPWFLRRRFGRCCCSTT